MAGRHRDSPVRSWTRIVRCPDGGVSRPLAGRLMAVRSPRNEAGERLAG